MFKNLIIFSILLASTSAMAQPLVYPETRPTGHTDTYFGNAVADPYHWLEDDRSTETMDWVKRQNIFTQTHLDKIPYRPQLLERMQQLSNYEKYSSPQKVGKYIFFYKNDGLQNQAVLYRQVGMDGTPEVFLDPNAISIEGTTTVGLLDFSKDDKLVAFSVQKAGSDWQEIVVYDVATAEAKPDTLKWVKFSGASWHGNGFYYSRYDAPKGSALSEKNEYHKVYFHQMGTAQAADKLIYSDAKQPLRYFSAQVTEDEQYLAINISEGTSGSEIWVKNLKTGQADFTKVCPGFTNDFSLLDTDGSRLIVYTNYQAPTYQVLSIDPKNPAKKNWKVLLGPKAEILQGFSPVGDKYVANYLKDVSTRLSIYNRKGEFEKSITLPTVGTAGLAEGDRKNKDAFVAFTSFTFPNTLYSLDIATGALKEFRKPNVPIDLNAFEVNQVFYTSKDGTKVPMFLIHKKGLQKDGKRPTLLYGYGGFNISIEPAFSTTYLALAEQGGIVAVANIRGGGEYGEKWHKAGMLEKRQTVFDDFIAAGEYLCAQKYTSPEKLAIHGGSNGGLLVGACMVQRPDLFRVALPAVGVLDMLRFHKFTIGWGWVVEYGSSDSAAQFAFLRKYSPLHNIKPQAKYPATMILTGDHDDRVVPAHSFKFGATLQAAQGAPAPILIRIDVNAGHGAGKPISKTLEEKADILSFMLWNMDVAKLTN